MATLNTAEKFHVKKPKIILVEDETDVRELIALHLEREGFQVTSFECGSDAIEYIEANEGDISAAIFDWMLPDMSGLELVRKFATTLPTLMLTARADTNDIVRGLESGADDYLAKPFDIPVLLARVHALLRRGTPNKTEIKSNKKMLEIPGIQLDLTGHRVYSDQQEIILTLSEFKLLQTLLTHCGSAMSRDALIQQIQGEGVIVVDRVIDTHIFGLRKKLGPNGHKIESVRGIGYRVNA